jgi:predicted ATPase
MVDPVSDSPFVFISYASVNRSRVIEIVDCLESTGIGVWFDRSDIPGGTSYGPEIVSGIKNAAAIVLMCSEASLASRNVRQEIQLAWRHERPILPLLLEPLIFPDDVSYWLEGAQWIEVLDYGPDTWLDQVRYALALMGYAGLSKKAATTVDQESSPLVELPPNNVPDATNPLIGRDRELRQIRSLIEHARVLTLTGTGGTGKTHLAEQAARESAIRFADGIWFIDAAGTRDATSLIEAIAAVLGIQETAGELLIESLTASLTGRRMLLILDNLEQNASAGEVVNALTVQDGPVVLGTSRAPIHAIAEMVVPVSPLESPDLQPDTPASVTARNPAVQLFVERAKQVKPDFQLSDGNAFEVAGICAKLDGLPLAIELAAARSRLLHPATLLARLDSRLNVLTRGSGRSARQQTLQSTIAWSYDLLGPVEQTVFRRAGIFAGGASLEMAEQVISSAGEDVAHDEVLDAIDELIDHSLLELDRNQSDDDSTRVRMLETIREYALATLAEIGELESTSLAHASSVLGLVEELEPQLEAGQQALALSRLSRDQANIGVALSYLAESANSDNHQLAVRMAGSLWRYWWMRGAFSEGARLLEAALNSGSGEATVDRAKALNGAGIMAFSLGDLKRAHDLHLRARDLCIQINSAEELARSLDNLGIVHIVSGDVAEGTRNFLDALESYRRTGDKRGEALSLDHLAGAFLAADNLEAAHAYSVQSVAAWKRLGDQHGIGIALQQLGITSTYQGAYEDAAGYLEQALALAEAQGDPVTLGNALLNLASAVELGGDPARAQEMLGRALRLYEEANDLRSAGYAKYMLGHVARMLGNLDDAQAFLHAGLELLEAAGQQDAIALSLETLAGVSADRNDFELAAELLSKARHIRDSIGVPVPNTRTEELDRDVAAIRRELGQARFAELLGSTAADPAAR